MAFASCENLSHDKFRANELLGPIWSSIQTLKIGVPPDG